MANKQKLVLCRNCNSTMEKGTKKCPACGAKNKKPFYKKWWFILIVVCFVIGLISPGGGDDKEKSGEKIDWDDLVLGDMIPEPKVNEGDLTIDSEDRLYVSIYKMSKEDFNEYIADCKELGYTVESKKTSISYKAYNEEGYSLRLSYYETGKEMTISLSAEEEETEKNTQEEKTTEKTSDEDTSKEDVEEETTTDNESELVDGMRPEFKEAMDKYEDFMNEYCDFMKKYADSDGTDLGLLADYATYMTKYTEAMEAFEKWEDEEMNTKEAAYYLEVQTRINKRLVEVAQ